MKKYILLTTSITLLSCAHVEYDGRGIAHYKPEKKQFETLAAKPICCESIKAFDYQVIELKKKLTCKITPSSPKFNFPSGESYFVAIALPEAQSPLKVNVKSFFDKFAFYPEVVVLDENYDVIQIFGRDDINLHNRGRFSAATVEGNLTLSGPGENGKYLIIRTTDWLLSVSDMYRGNQLDSYYLHFGPEGRIELTVTI